MQQNEIIVAGVQVRAETERERRQDRLVDSAAELFTALVTLEADAAAFLLRFVNRALMLLTRPIVLASTHRSASAGWPAISSIETDTRSSESASRQSARTRNASAGVSRRHGWTAARTQRSTPSFRRPLLDHERALLEPSHRMWRLDVSLVVSQRDGRYVNIPRLLR